MGLLNFLTSGSKVSISANETLPDKPLITPFLDAQGNPKTDNNQRPLGSIKFRQTLRTLNGTFINAGNRVAFLAGTIEELENIIKQNKLSDGTEVPGRIIIRESLKPFYPNQRGKVNPATDEAIGYTFGGTFYPVYMQMLYVDNENTPDILIRSEETAYDWLNAHGVNMIAAEQHAQPVETMGVPATGN
jgi:hypothetical protein